MPYIAQDSRDDLDPIVEKLATEINLMGIGEYAGCLNYAITTLLIKTTRKRYGSICIAMGTLACVAQEFYRRFAAPYEDKKCAENGEVF